MGEDRRSGGASSAHIPRLEDAVYGSSSGSGTSQRRQSGSGGQNGGGQRQQNSLSDMLGQQGEWVDKVRHTVREHPLAAVAGALVLGTLLSRRRH